MNEEFRSKLTAIILNSPYKQRVNCILRLIENANMVTLQRLQDLPSLGHFCGLDVYQLLALINENWAIIDITPKKQRKVSKKTVDDVAQDVEVNDEMEVNSNE